MAERTDWFKRAVDILTLIVLVAGFWMAIDQAKKLNETIAEAQRSSDVQTWNNVSQQWLAMDQILIQHPESRPYIFGGKDLSESDPAYTMHKAVAAFVLDFLDYAVSTSTDLLNNRQTKTILHPEGWMYEFLIVFSQSPVVCRTVFENEQVYAPMTRDLARRGCRSRLRIHTPPP